MKRVLQSCFEPLPRFMSTKSLCAVVALLLVGTAISVFEYIESSREPIRRIDPCVVDPSSCRASRPIQEPRFESVGSAEILLPSVCPRAAAHVSTAGCSSASSAEAPPRRTADADVGVCTAPPSVFQPTSDSVGG
jgi:hypothetical protein